MRRATAHAFAAAPGSAKAFYDFSGAAFEWLSYKSLGHASTPVGMPSPRAASALRRYQSHFLQPMFYICSIAI